MSATLLPFPQHRVRPFLSLEERAGIEAAIEQLLAILDQSDGDPEIEDTAPEKHGGAFLQCSADDIEGDELEEMLGWPANIVQTILGPNSADADATALETHGAGFRRSGPDDCEDGHDAEAVNEDGDPLDCGEWDEAEAIDRWHARCSAPYRHTAETD